MSGKGKGAGGGTGKGGGQTPLGGSTGKGGGQTPPPPSDGDTEPSRRRRITLYTYISNALEIHCQRAIGGSSGD